MTSLLLLLRRRIPFTFPFSSTTASSSFSTTPPAAKSISKVPLPPRPKPPPESEIEENLVKGSGPGGQKINKTSSAVQLKHLPTGIVVKSQATRSLAQNRKIARNLLAERLDALHNGDASRASVVGQIKKKRRDSADKRSRRKYRMLDEAREDDGGEEGTEEGTGTGTGSKRGKPHIEAVRADKEPPKKSTPPTTSTTTTTTSP